MIELKDIQGNILLSVPITQSCQKVEELMVADYIQLSWDSNLSDEIPLGAYIEYNGERYSLLEPYNPTQKNESNYTYIPKFESRVRAWGKKPFFFYSGESKEPDWTLTSNPADFMRCVCDAILKETGESWTYSIDASLAVSASLSFSSSDILSGLNQIADAFETEWLADKETNTIYLGLLSYGEEVTLEVGNNIGVPSIQNSKEGYYTRFYAFGSTRNITQDYTGSNTNNLVNKRLTLDPNKYPQGYKDIRVGLSKGEIFSKVLIFDNVYPSSKLSISGVRNRLMYRLDDSGDKIQLGTDESGNPIYDQYTIWYFRLEGFTFDWNNVIEGLTPSISFQSGALNGREFEIIYHDKSKKITTSDGLTFEVKEGDYEICFVEENNLIIPSMTGLIPNDGDKVIVFNIKMPSEYTQSAYIELEEELDKAIARMTSDLNNYSFKSNPVVFNESNPDLSIGRKVRYVNGSYSYSTRVIKLNTQLDFPIEQTITIGNEKVKGNTQQLREEVVSANKNLNLMSVFNNMTQSLQQSYNRTQQMMLEGFAAIKNIWQIRETENGEKYIFSAYDVATQKGITMYHDGKMLNLPSLASGLPFDGRTIWYNPDTNQIEVIGGTGGGSGEGVSNFWDLSGIPSWITNSKPKYTYSEIEGTPDLTKYALVSQIPSLSGYATESWVTGKNYITSATLGTELGRYVTLDTDQSLKGKKDFKNGLSIDGLELRKSQDDVIYIDANLVVRGGVTMYAQNEVDIPSIIDAIPTASTTVKGIASFDGNYFSVDANGKVSLIASNVGLNEEELYNYLTSNNYAKKTDIPSLVGYATQSWVNTRIDSLINGAPAAYDTLKEIADVLQGNVNSIGDIITALGTKWTQDNTKIANWDTAYSWGNHANVGYALKSYVDSTFVTLGSTQTITGEKNFTGGLKVNGSPIYYDTEKKYWKFEGDLLVTGGVTMYGSDSSFTPSTIMDAIAVDGTTISKSGGILKVIGGTGGGVADSVAWANITGKPTFATVATSGKYSDLSGTPSSLPASDVYSWAKASTKPSYSWSEITSKPTWIGSSKPSYSYSEITGAISTTELQNYLTQNSYLNVTSGDNRYLKLSGGTVTGTANVITINRTDLSQPCISYEYNGTSYGSIGLNGYGDAFVYNGNKRVINKIWHEGNLNPSDYLLLTGGTIKGQLTISKFPSTIAFLNAQGIALGHIGYGGVDNPVVYMSDGATNYKLLHSGNIDSYKAGSATKLATARTIWGKSFDGTGNIDGELLINTSFSGDVLSFNDTRTTQGVLTMRFDRNYVDYGGINWFHDGYNGYAYNSTSHINIGHSTGFVSLGLWTSPLLIADIDKKCVGINNTTPSFELDVKGAIRASTYVKVGAQPDNDFPNFINAATTYSGWHTLLGCNGRGFIFGQDREDSTIAKIQPYGSTTAFKYTKIESAVEISNAISTAPASIRFCMNQGGGKDGNANIEFMTGTAYIDWHYAGDTSVDYTTRLIEGEKGILTLKGGLNIDTTLIVTEDAEFKKRAFVKNYITFSDLDAVGGANTSTARIGTFDHNEGGIVIQLGKSGTTGSTPSKQRFEIINAAWNTALMWVDRSGNMLVNGGITMYSDQRKKTILNHVELSLKQIAEAPLIEHYYNSDEKKTTHVGSIAQYWAGFNDWFCKLDSEGYYTMEIQNAALASAISIARELDRYETKTDKDIKKLKKRICELEEEVERLKSA